MGRIFLAEGIAQARARGQEQLVVGNAKHMCIPFYFGAFIVEWKALSTGKQSQTSKG